MTTTRPTSGALHLLRAGVLGVTALGLAVAAHLAAGGDVPGILGLAALALMTTATVLVVTTVRLQLPGVVAALGVLELVLHGGLTLLTAGGSATVVASCHHHASIAVTGAQVHAGHGLAMTAAHAVATLLTALVLARGEQLLWLVAGIVAPVVAHLVAACLDAARTLAPQPAPAPVPAPRMQQQYWSIAAPRRGPPVLG